MTVSATATSVSYSPGDAMAQQSLASLHFLDSSHLIVTHEDADTGVLTVLAEGDNYTIGGSGTAGTATITATAEYPAGDIFHVERRTPATQPADLVAFEDLPAAAIEAA